MEKQNKTKVIITLGAILLLLVAGTLGYFFYFKKLTLGSKKEEAAETTVGTIELPKNITRAQAENPDEKTKELIGKLISKRIKSLKVIKGTDYIPVVTKDGKPVMPDAQKAAKKSASIISVAQAASEQKLKFIWDDSDQKWTEQEKQFLNQNQAEVYEHIKSIVGEPAFAVTINVVKSNNRGFYSPWENKMSIYPLSGNDAGIDKLNLATFVHETTHAFNDDFIFSNRGYEEGTATFVETEWNRKYAYNNFRPYNYNAYSYYQNNQPLIATGNFYSDSFGTKYVEPVSELDHYYMSGYAMEKVWRADSTNVKKFRAKFFEAIKNWQNETSAAYPGEDVARKIFREDVSKIEGMAGDQYILSQYVLRGANLTNAQYLGIIGGKIYFMRKGVLDGLNNLNYYEPIEAQLQDAQGKVLKRETLSADRGYITPGWTMTNDFSRSQSFFKVVLKSKIGTMPVENVSWRFLPYGGKDSNPLNFVMPALGQVVRIKDKETGTYVKTTTVNDYLTSDEVTHGHTYIAEVGGKSYEFINNSFPYWYMGSLKVDNTQKLAIHWLTPRDPDVPASFDPNASSKYVFSNGSVYYPNKTISISAYLTGNYQESSATINGESAYSYNGRINIYRELKGGENTFTIKVKDLDGNEISSTRKVFYGTVGKIDRIYGSDRYQTAVKISQNKTSYSSRTDVVLTTGENWPDAISASLIASNRQSSLLYARKDSIPDVTMAEIRRLNPYNITIVGGTGAISQTVSDRLNSEFSHFGATGVTITRIGGDTRYKTNLAAIDFLIPTNGDFPREASTIIVATGKDFPDAATALPVAGRKLIPIFLVDQAASPELLKKVTALKTTKTIVMGSNLAISDSTMKQFPGAIRVSGADRYETAVNFANYAMANLNSTDPRNPLSNEISFGTVGLATGTNYPDALAAANYLTTEGGLLLLTNTTLPTKVGSLIKAQSSKINILHVFGSNLAVSDSVYNQVKNLLNSSAVKGASYDGRTFGEKTWDFLKNLVGIQS